MRTAATILAAAAVAAGCRGQTRALPAEAEVPPPAGAISVRTSGARGDGSDDRHAFQSAIDQAALTGGVVYVPPGTYTLGPAPSRPYSLMVPGGVTIRGAGPQATRLRQAPGADRSVRLLYVTGDDNALEDITLDGNKREQTPDGQRHGIFAFDSQRLIVRRVTSTGFTGDGFYLYNGVRDARFEHVRAAANDRNGLTMGGAVDGTQIVTSQFVGNRAQQIDSEPGGAAVVSNTTITGSLLDTGGVSKDYVLTCSGTSSQSRGRGWRVVGNTINGAIFSVWADDVVIANNTGVNPTPKSSVTINRASTSVEIVGNKLRMTQTQVPALAAVLIQGTAGSAPSRVVVAGNQIQVDYERSFGIRADGALDVEITRNDLRGSGRRAPGFAGIRLRATVAKRDFERVVIADNSITDFGERGVAIAGNGAARLLSVDIRGNTFAATARDPSMTTAISLDDGSGAVRDVSIADNQLGCGVSNDVVDLPAGAGLTQGEVPPKRTAPDASAPPDARARVFVKPSRLAAKGPCTTR
jgi:hypothetical protein